MFDSCVRPQDRATASYTATSLQSSHSPFLKGTSINPHTSIETKSQFHQVTVPSNKRPFFGSKWSASASVRRTDAKFLSSKSLLLKGAIPCQRKGKPKVKQWDLSSQTNSKMSGDSIPSFWVPSWNPSLLVPPELHPPSTSHPITSKSTLSNQIWFHHSKHRIKSFGSMSKLINS